MGSFRRLSPVIATMVLAGLLLGGARAASAAPAEADNGGGVAPALASCNTHTEFNNGVDWWTWPTFGTNPNCVMGRGNVSEGVRWLQFDLNACNGQSLATDGIYGPATERAVRNVQAANGITADGVYGPVTRSRMAWLTNTIDGGAYCGRHG